MLEYCRNLSPPPPFLSLLSACNAREKLSINYWAHKEWNLFLLKVNICLLDLALAYKRWRITWELPDCLYTDHCCRIHSHSWNFISGLFEIAPIFSRVLYNFLWTIWYLVWQPVRFQFCDITFNDSTMCH